MNLICDEFGDVTLDKPCPVCGRKRMSVATVGDIETAAAIKCPTDFIVCARCVRLALCKMTIIRHGDRVRIYDRTKGVFSDYMAHQAWYAQWQVERVAGLRKQTARIRRDLLTGLDPLTDEVIDGRGEPTTGADSRPAASTGVDRTASSEFR